MSKLSTQEDQRHGLELFPYLLVQRTAPALSQNQVSCVVSVHLLGSDR